MLKIGKLKILTGDKTSEEHSNAEPGSALECSSLVFIYC
jgi:hypothetical protein